MNIGQEAVIDIPYHKSKLWNMHYVNTLMVTLLINISGIMLISILPLFTVSIGGNNFYAGVLTTILTFSALIFRPFFGRIIDEQGRQKVLVLGLCLFAVSTLSFVMAVNIPVLFLLRFIQGIGLSAYTTALGTILSDVVPNHRMAEGVGYFGISATIAMAVGPTLGLYSCDKFGYHRTYIITFGIAFISILFANFIKYEEKKYNKAEQTILKRSFIENTAIRPCIVIFFIVFAISSVFSFMPLFGEQRNIDNIGMFFTVYAVSVIAMRLFTGKIADRYGYSKVFLPAITITFMLFVTLAFANSLPTVILAAIFYGVGYGTIQPIMNTMVIKFSPVERRGAANATYYATMDIGFGLGAFVWGLVSQFADFTVVFLGCSVCIIISVMAYYFILHTWLKEPRDVPN